MKEEPISDCEEDDLTKEETDNSSSKRLGCRYWNSYEEVLLIEMWKKYAKFLTDFTESLPIFGKVSNEMQKRGVFVNRQECRRKLIVFNHKYSNELKKMQKTNKPSDWRLFPFIHNILSEDKDESAEEEHEVIDMTTLEMQCKQTEETTDPIRSSELMKFHFTLTGVEKLRRQNQVNLWECAELKRHLMIKKRELQLIQNAHKYLDDCIDKLDHNNIHDDNRNITDLLPVILFQALVLCQNI